MGSGEARLRMWFAGRIAAFCVPLVLVGVGVGLQVSGNAVWVPVVVWGGLGVFAVVSVVVSVVVRRPRADAAARHGSPGGEWSDVLVGTRYAGPRRPAPPTASSAVLVLDEDPTLDLGDRPVDAR